jgi:hypothetical protein
VRIIAVVLKFLQLKKIIDLSVDKHRRLLHDREEEGQCTANIDSQRGKITKEIALVKIVDGIRAVYFKIWRKKVL